MIERREGRSVVIVGASAAGLRCACRLARLDPSARVRVIERNPVFSYAACGLPYALSGDVPEVDELRRTTWGSLRDEAFFADWKGVEVITGTRALEIDPERRLLHVEGPQGREKLAWDALVLATGARPKRLPGQPEHPRVLTFHRWEDMERLHRGLARGEIGRVGILGAGLVGCELAEAFLALWGAEVTLVETAPHPLPALLDVEAGALVATELRRQGVRLLLGTRIDEIEARDDGVVLRVGARDIEVDVVVVAVGVEPEVELARTAGIALGPTGAIAVDHELATSVPGIWAAGDCVEVRHAVTGEPCWIPLGSLANRQGRVLGTLLAGRPDRFPAVAGAAAVKVFDLRVGAVGLTREVARAHGFEVRSAWMTAYDRAHYWPEAEDLHLQLTWEPGTRRILGVQAVGRGDAIKRIDVATQHLVRGGTLEDLAALEHAYAPPFAPALDPLAVVAHVAQNVEDGIAIASPLIETGGRHVIDVRLEEERRVHPCTAGDATSVALPEVRKEPGLAAGALVVCERGTRAAEAVRIVRNRGGKAIYLGGGISWRYAAGMGDVP